VGLLNGHTDIPAFPFCHVTLRGRKPRKGYPEEPQTLGEHLKKRRLDRGLRQKDVAGVLGVTVDSYNGWEHDRHEPEVVYWSGITDFLGYDPNPAPQTLGERIKAKRRREGLTLREVARRLEVDLGTVMAWEKDEVRKPYPRYVRLFEQFVEGV
jgi:transcriptional regulator with XRE-family HTH domain